MKPRTFRRVVLLGSLGAIILIVALGYFVVRPWQNQRQLEAMRTNGIAAYENGEYLDTMRLLGRYTNNAEEFEPELYLKLARAAEKYQANDGGNIVVSVNAYRNYLRRVPGDVEAMMDLLPLLNTSSKFVEAESLAVDLRDKHGVDDIAVLREWRFALQAQEAADSKVEPVLRALFDHEQSELTDAHAYLRFLRNHERGEEADALLDERIAAHPTRLQELLLDFGRRSDSFEVDGVTYQDIVNEICSMIGLDPDSRDWDPEAPELTLGDAWYINRVLNSSLRPDLAISVQLRRANEHGDLPNTVWAARRLYWTGRDQELMGMENTTRNDEPDSDVLGYQYLSAKRSGDSDTMQEKLEAIDGVVLDHRGRAWKQYLDGLSAFERGESVDARVAIEKAISIYPSEPTYRLTMGDVHLAQGRFNDAVKEWVVSSEFVNDKIGSLARFDVNAWPAPVMRIVEAYAAERRFGEAGIYIDELERIAILGRDARAAEMILNARADLARQGQLLQETADQFAERWESVRLELDPDLRARSAPQIAEIFGSTRHSDLAREEIQHAIQVRGDDAKLLSRLADVDYRYNLGAFDGSGINPDELVITTASQALRRAAEEFEQTRSLERAIQVFDELMQQAAPENPEQWMLTRARFVDNIDRDKAVTLWDQLLTERPDDIELLYEAIDSDAYAQDLNRVDELIDTVVELTSTGGKAIPSRLRLARANAIVSGQMSRTKTNRDRAMEIVRSIVANEPLNTRARNMLGRLLALQPSPGIPDSERYEPERQKAIEQYMILSRQLTGSQARLYLLESFDLAFQMNDEDQARELLREYESRFSSDVYALPTIAERYENLGDLARAAELYQRVYSSAGISDAGLSLADMRLKQGQAAEGKALLKEISERSELSARSVLRLASLYARSGNVPEGDQIARSGERYGMNELDAQLLYAEFAGLYLSRDAEIDALKEATQVDPQSRQAWKRLVMRLIEFERLDEAQSAYADAITHVQVDEELTRFGILAQGSPDSAEDMLRLPGMDDPLTRQMIERVGKYDQLDPRTSDEEKFAMLTSMIADYPGQEVLLAYCVRQLPALQVRSDALAELADRALRSVPSSAVIMGITGELYLNSSLPQEAMRAIDLWRANSLETNVVANVIYAKALIQLEQYTRAEHELSSYVDDAFRNHEERVSREILDSFCYVRLKQGEDPAVTSDRLRPLIETDSELRNRTWLGLASNVISDLDTAKEWIRVAESYAEDDDRLQLANAWIVLAFRNEAWEPEIAQEAKSQLESILLEGDEGAYPHVLLGRTELILARASSDPAESTEHYERVVETMLHAAALDPTNLLPLLDAARFAVEGGLNSEAVDVYQRVLDLGIPDSPLKAMVSNNLAMSRLRAGVERDSDQQELVQLVDQSTRLQPEVPSYWGTRGWVELHFGLLEEAESSFRRALSLNPDGAEGIAGLLIVLSARETTDESEIDRLSLVLRSLRSSGSLDPEIEAKLSEFGVEF